jgi:hypothetical protein
MSLAFQGLPVLRMYLGGLGIVQYVPLSFLLTRRVGKYCETLSHPKPAK